MPTALDLIDLYIADLEAKLNLPPGGSLAHKHTAIKPKEQTEKPKQSAKQKPKKDKKKSPNSEPPSSDQADICKLEFKVGVITKVWVHPDADKLYCEEIDVGEENPRQIASGLRLHYTEDQMLHRKLLVVSNLKPKNLVGFKSFGMVLCASHTNQDGTETVEFIEPPPEAKVGEIITFRGLPPPQPVSAAQVEKKKIFIKCMEGMRTTEEEGLAAWNGHVFETSAGPCRSKTIKGGVMR